ncbi:MAG: polyprenyl synthetase family protein [Candidatus Omnitrophica bacterium]|nr:polyprenyl synthetase family protein [Candidatus Omnitrophota bacterium]MDD5512735.1 polyprenyl synthetase family protein [Candidatus Omnitrophota bacterium]
MKIRKKIEQELDAYCARISENRELNAISPFLFGYIKEFIRRPGKRLRPVLFVVGYLGFARKTPRGLYTSAISIELLHDFMLVHDDIIDKSDTRRGKPSMHKMFNDYLGRFPDIKFNGQDLAIVAGDVIYAMGVDAFLSVKENPLCKEAALRQLIKAALYTGSGEFIELLAGSKKIEKIEKSDIYKIYDYKTAYYSFSSPLAIGSILAGANQTEVNKLTRYGIELGRAFQIKDDILGMFGEENKIGKSALADLQEAKKTLLIWYAFNHSGQKNKSLMKNILGRQKARRAELLKMRELIRNSGALEYAKKEVNYALENARAILDSSKMTGDCKKILQEYGQSILHL